MNKITLIALLVFVAFRAGAQQEFMLFQADERLWNRNALNPAIFPEEKKIAIGSGFTLDQIHSGEVAPSEVLRKEGDKTYLDFGQILPKLEANNTFDLDQRVETVSAGLRRGKWAFTLGHAIRANARFEYPKSLVELLWNGNGPYIGQTLTIGPAINFSSWNELGLGVSRQFGGLRLGGRVKYLAGVAALETEDDHRLATLYTNPDIYQLELETDYAFRAASTITAVDTAGYGFDFKTEKLRYARVFSKNSGIAFDLGATLKLGERLRLQASLLDLGGTVKWTEKANHFHSKGAWEYDGVEIPGVDIINGSDSLTLGNQLDTLNDIFRFVKTPEEFSTSLPLRAYVGGSYKLTKKLTLGAAYYLQKGGAYDLSAVGVNAQIAPIKQLVIGAAYSVNNRDQQNFGMSLGAFVGPVQLHLASDNLLNVFKAKTAPALNWRLGGALVF